MNAQLTANASTTVKASRNKVWDALVNPVAIKEYMFGAEVESEWRKGSPIVWRGTWKGKPYEDKGEVLVIEPEKKLQYTHFSPMSGDPDKPEFYHTVTVELQDTGQATRLSLSQDNNPTIEARDHSAKNWTMMLEGLKKFVER